MFTFLKFLPQIILGFKDVSEKYRTETGQGRPFYMSRSFNFSALCFIGTAVALFTGISFDPAILQVIADNIPTLVSAAIALISAILSIFAQAKTKTSTDSTAICITPVMVQAKKEVAKQPTVETSGYVQEVKQEVKDERTVGETGHTVGIDKSY